MDLLRNILFASVAIIFVAALVGLAIGVTIASGGFFFALFCVALIYGILKETWENYTTKK